MIHPHTRNIIKFTKKTMDNKCHVDILSGMGNDVPCVTYSNNNFKLNDIYKPETYNNRKKRETVVDLQDAYSSINTKNTITSAINDLERDIEQDIIDEKRKHRTYGTKYRCLVCFKKLLKIVKIIVIGVLLVGGLFSGSQVIVSALGHTFPTLANLLTYSNSFDMINVTERPKLIYGYTTPDDIVVDVPENEKQELPNERATKLRNKLSNNKQLFDTFVNYINGLITNEESNEKLPETIIQPASFSKYADAKNKINAIIVNDDIDKQNMTDTDKKNITNLANGTTNRIITTVPITTTTTIVHESNHDTLLKNNTDSNSIPIKHSENTRTDGANTTMQILPTTITYKTRPIPVSNNTLNESL